jgi:flagellar hook assembly protein FlgD
VEPGMQPVTTYRLLENYPNPFNPATTIRYSMTQPGQVTLKIYDITGRLVNTLIDAQMPQGIHRISWDGRDANGISVATGVYFYTIETPNMSKTAKMVLIK